MGVNDMPRDLSCAGWHLTVIRTRNADGVGEGTKRRQCTTRKTCVHFVTRGMYRQLVDQLRLTITSMSRMSIAQTMDNVTVEDVACILVVDGVTIPQARDAHEWGLNTLNLWSQVVDANRRTEAMQALMAV